MAKTALSHQCHAALQPIVRLDRHRVTRHHLAHRRLLRIEPGQQHFDGAVTLGHDTDQHVVVDDQHRPDPVVAHLAQGFDDHVAGTNMDQGTSLLGQSVFYCAHRSLSWALSCPALKDSRNILPRQDSADGGQYSSNICWISSGLVVLVRANCRRMRAFCGLRLSAATKPGSCQLSSRTTRPAPTLALRTTTMPVAS